MKTTILGCGRWASFLAWYCLRLRHEVMVYGRSGSVRFQSLASTQKNEYVSLEGPIQFTEELADAVAYSEVILISISAQQWRVLADELAQQPLKGKTIVLCMKGLDDISGLRLSEVFVQAQTSQGQAALSTAVWLGPGHVQDFVAEKPNCMVIDSNQTEVSQSLVERFSSPLIRFYLGQDMLGNEVGAAAKNVIGIAAGMLDGQGLTPLKGALMARGAYEVAQLIQAMGGSSRSAYGLAHLGDYQATLFSEHSHNRCFGEAFVRGERFDKLAEGVGTLAVMQRFGCQYQVDLPICEAVDAVLHQQADPKEVLQHLLSRPLTAEFV